MSRLLLAGLFIFSLTVWTGCEASGGPATSTGKNEKKSANITGMSGSKSDEGKSGELPPPPKLTIPEGAK